MNAIAPPGWPAESAEAFVDDLLGWIARAGARRYDEAVSQADHALQCAHLAARAGDTDEAVAAALLHDVGHLLLGEPRDGDGFLDGDREHEVIGARWLERMFPAGVTGPVAAHVAAKRYLCAVDPGYHDRLSPGSVRSLALQGGPMSDREVADRDTDPAFLAAVALRRRDEAAKVRGRDVPGLDTYRDLLVSLVRITS